MACLKIECVASRSSLGLSISQVAASKNRVSRVSIFVGMDFYIFYVSHSYKSKELRSGDLGGQYCGLYYPSIDERSDDLHAFLVKG
jgi:hypothetical protein